MIGSLRRLDADVKGRVCFTIQIPLYRSSRPPWPGECLHEGQRESSAALAVISCRNVAGGLRRRPPVDALPVHQLDDPDARAAHIRRALRSEREEVVHGTRRTLSW